MDSGPAGAVCSLHTTVFFSPQSLCLMHTGKPTGVEIAAIHQEATARDLIPKISFISKDQFQTPPPLILALPKKSPSNYSFGGIMNSGSKGTDFFFFEH